MIAHSIDSGELAGAVICRDHFSEIPEELNVWVKTTMTAPIIKIIYDIDELWAKDHGNKSIGHCMNLFIGVVEEKFRGRNILKHLLQCALQLGSEQGYTVAVGEFTNYYSRKVGESVGFIPKHEISYKDFEFEGKKIFANVPQPHKSICFMVKNLT